MEPKRKTLEHYIVIHFAAMLVISMFQFTYGTGLWWGFGFVTPIILICNGFVYSAVENNSWYREQMVPFISRVISTTEIETDRYRQYHRSANRIVFILGYLVILICQGVWTFGLTIALPVFADGNFLIRELLAYAILFGPFFLYFFLLIIVGAFVDEILPPRYRDIAHLFVIENKWAMENQRRAKVTESAQEGAPSDNQ
ncbi:MAG: hypothetical protein RTV31_00775 [Candidatus Thorarchaeota archaeon]